MASTFDATVDPVNKINKKRKKRNDYIFDLIHEVVTKCVTTICSAELIPTAE